MTIQTQTIDPTDVNGPFWTNNDWFVAFDATHHVYVIEGSKCSNDDFFRGQVYRIISLCEPSSSPRKDSTCRMVGKLLDGRYFYLDAVLGTSLACKIVADDFYDLYWFGMTDEARTILFDDKYPDIT